MNIWSWLQSIFAFKSITSNLNDGTVSPGAANTALTTPTTHKTAGQHQYQPPHWLTADTGCDRPWPSLELFLPIALAEPHGKNREAQQMRRRNAEFGVWLMRSLFLFWPLERSRTTLRLIFDEEVGPTMPQGNFTHLHRAAWNAINFYVRQYQKYHPSFLPSSWFRENFTAISTVYKKGYDRQQWLMFWADNFTTAEYVGFIDTDTLFTTYVDREDLFDHGRPVVNGRIGVNPRPPWSHVPANTLNFTGVLEPMRCMSYFPVVIKTAHLVDFRRYIETLHGRPFDAVFERLFAANGMNSQFNIMCAYLYTHRRSEVSEGELR